MVILLQISRNASDKTSLLQNKSFQSSDLYFINFLWKYMLIWPWAELMRELTNASIMECGTHSTTYCFDNKWQQMLWLLLWSITVCIKVEMKQKDIYFLYRSTKRKIFMWGSLVFQSQHPHLCNESVTLLWDDSIRIIGYCIIFSIYILVTHIFTFYALDSAKRITESPNLGLVKLDIAWLISYICANYHGKAIGDFISFETLAEWT